MVSSKRRRHLGKLTGRAKTIALYLRHERGLQ